MIRPGRPQSRHDGRRSGLNDPRAEASVQGGVIVAGLPVHAATTHSLPKWMSGGGLVDHARLVVAGRRVRLGRGAFIASVLGTLTLILVTSLVLNTGLTTDSFELQTLRVADSQLAVKEQELLGKLADVQAPLGLGQKARELGMVVAPNPVFLRLADRKMLGEADPAQMPAPPTPPKAAKPKPATPADSAPAGTVGPGGESPAEAVGGSGSVGAVPVVPGPSAVRSPATPEPGGETGVGLVALGP